MSLIIELNASANIFYLLKHLLHLNHVIFKIKCNNLTSNEIMILNASYVCLLHSCFVENHPIWILEDGPLIFEVVLSQRGHCLHQPRRRRPIGWLRKRSLVDVSVSSSIKKDKLGGEIYFSLSTFAHRPKLYHHCSLMVSHLFDRSFFDSFGSYDRLLLMAILPQLLRLATDAIDNHAGSHR
jgi:hypothetical protein